MVYVRRVWTNAGPRFYLCRTDRSVVNYRYFKGIQGARKYAEELGLKVIN